MTIIATEGFDHYASFTDLASRQGTMTWGSTVSPTIVTPGRGGFGSCLSIPGSSFLNLATTVAFNANQATWYAGFAASVGSGTPASFTVSLYDPIGTGAIQTEIVFNMSAGQITVYRLTGASPVEIGASAPSVFPGAGWFFVEIFATIDSSAGVVEVRINNQPAITLTGVNNQGTAHATWGGIQFNVGTSGSVLIDDFRYNDTTTGPGIYPTNGWLGDLRVATLWPNGNSSVAWTPLTGTNWQEVSETFFDGDTSYNFTAVTGDEDLFNFDSLAAVIDQVVSVQIVGGYRQADAGAHTLTQQIKMGATDTPGATKTLSDTYQFFTDLFPVNPTTGASWTLTDVNSLLAGYKSVT